MHISIHAPRVGCDRVLCHIDLQTFAFQSTHPVWGATFACSSAAMLTLPISIHAPRVGCDSTKEQCCFFLYDFNPRTPCGVRPRAVLLVRLRCPISIHAPRVGCDPCSENNYQRCGQFQSTHPVWGATSIVIYDC